MVAVWLHGAILQSPFSKQNCPFRPFSCGCQSPTDLNGGPAHRTRAGDSLIAEHSAQDWYGDRLGPLASAPFTFFLFFFCTVPCD